MADFNTHVIGASIVSGTSATALMMLYSFPTQTLMMYFMLGILGGILPDIDSDSSIPLRWIFNLLGMLTGFFLVLSVGAYYSLTELVILWCLSFIIVRYGIFFIFANFTIHRGLVHSIPAAAFFSLCAVLLAVRVFYISAVSAWLCGAFVLMGFLTHLLLDELCSVNLAGVYLKRSFGSALSFGSTHAPLTTGLLYLLTAVFFYLTPPMHGFIDLISNSSMHHLFLERLFPKQGWFNVFKHNPF